jgi:transglutaminase-like putative cysteine protease
MDKSRILLVFVLAGLFAGCAATGKAVIEQYKDVTPTRFEGAVAVVLEERETGKVDDTGESIVTEGFKRLKILDRKAMDCGVGDPNCRLERSVCYDETWSKVEMIEARTILPDGEIIEVEKDDMSDRTYTSWAVPDQDMRCWVWRMKGAVPGAIFEERYRIRSSKIFSAGGFWFGDRDPVLEATFTLDAPADYKYRWKTYNIDVKPTEKKAENRLIRTWSARDVSPVVVEYGMVAPDDVVAKLVIANNKISAWAEVSDKCNDVKTWEELGNCWHDMIKKKQKVTDEVKKVAEEIAKTSKSETDKVKAVWKWLNDNVRYVGLERGLAGWVPLSVHVVCTKKYGDCKAVAGLISVLCRELGLTADPILIGTRPQLGVLDTELPGPFYFNHSIARVEADGKVYWLDATNRDIDYKTTPYHDQGVHVVVARPDGKSFLDFIPLQPPEMSSEDIRMVFTPGENGTMTAMFDYTTTGNSAAYYRGASHQLVGEKWERWIESGTVKSYPQASVVEQSFSGKKDNNAPFNIKIKAKIEKALQPAGKGVSFEVKQFLRGSMIDYIQLPKRRYAVDLGHKAYFRARYEVVIPEGMEPAGLPKNVAFEDDYQKVERLTQIENDRVVTQITEWLKAVQVPPEKYPEFRKSFQKLWDAETYVLLFEPKKKKGS